jgi:hypothetical protein
MTELAGWENYFGSRREVAAVMQEACESAHLLMPDS